MYKQYKYIFVFYKVLCIKKIKYENKNNHKQLIFLKLFKRSLLTVMVISYFLHNNLTQIHMRIITTSGRN